MTNLISLDAIKLKEINRKFFNFIWNGKDKIKRSVLIVISNYDKGGLKMVHIESYISKRNKLSVSKSIGKITLQLGNKYWIFI